MLLCWGFLKPLVKPFGAYPGPHRRHPLRAILNLRGGIILGSLLDILGPILKLSGSFLRLSKRRLRVYILVHVEAIVKLAWGFLEHS